MENLPEELVLEIFSYLALEELRRGPSQVCKRWKDIVKLKTLQISCQRDLLCLADRTSYLISLQITTHIDFLYKLLHGLGTLCPRLVELTMHNCNQLSEGHVRLVSQYFPKLKHIDVFLASGFLEHYFIEGLRRVSSLVINNRILKTNLMAVAEKFSNIESLHMYGQVQYYPVNELNNLLCLRTDFLKDITLRCCEITDKTCAVLSSCEHLVHLRLYHCWLITQKGLAHLSKLCELRTLHLTGLKLVGKTHLSDFVFAINMPELIDCNFSSTSFSDEHIDRLSYNSPKIRTLELWKCKNLTTDGVYKLVDALKSLYILDLSMKLSGELICHISYSTNVKFLRFNVTNDVEGLVNRLKSVNVSSSFGQYGGKYFRGRGEGFRANLFYYSLQNAVVEPVKKDTEIDIDYMFE